MRKLRSEMTPQELAEARRRWKRWRVLKQCGKPAHVTPAEMDKVRIHVRNLSDLGMTMKDIAHAAGVYNNAPSRVNTGAAKTLTRGIYDRLMAAQYGPGSERCLVTDTMAVRRVRALVADGYTYKYLTKFMGFRSNSGMCKIAHSEGRMLVVTSRKIRLMYDKLAGADPFDTGESRKSHTQAKRMAARMGWAPTHCWDWDTIDQGDAIPEWTGACGTMAGYRIHYRERILPVCEACASAKYRCDREREGR